MNGFQCWFCGESIDRSDGGALIITVEGLWKWEAGVRIDDRPSQSVYAHSRCAKDRLAGNTMDIEPEIFGDDD